MVTTRPPKTIVKPTALGPVANTDTKLLIYGLFQKGRVLAQDGINLLEPITALVHRFLVSYNEHHTHYSGYDARLIGRCDETIPICRRA